MTGCNCENCVGMGAAIEFLEKKDEPMDIAMRLLKNEPADYVDTFRRVDNNIGADGRYMTDEELAEIDARYTELHDDEDHFEEYYNLLEAIELEQMRRKNESFDGIGYNEETGFTRSEPMNIAFQLLKEFYIDDNNPDTEGFYSPPEHAHEALAELPRNQRMDNFRNYGGDISDLQDKGKYSRGGSQPRLQPSGAFVGARVGIDTDDSDESIQSLGDTLGHEYVHSLIEPEVNEWAEQKHGPLQSQVKPLYQQVQTMGEQEGRQKWLRPKGPITNQSELDAEKQRIDLGTQAKTYAHEYGAHQSDQASKYGVNSQLAGRSDTQDMYNQYLQPLQPQAMNMLPPMQEQQPEMIQQGEPMDIAFQLLKDAVSPEAKRHKLEYDKKYESNPERVKYREDLNRERRKRGIYGHGGPDMSHTKDHTLVAESPHANRARHFKERGTLKG
jgi:hypothetical protein